MPVGKTYWVEKGMLSTVLENVDQDGDGRADHVRFWVKSSFIHAVHPLGFIRKIRVELDGRQAALDDIFFVLRGNWIPARYVPTICDIWWNLGEKAYLYVSCPGGMPAGEHELRLDMEFSTLFNTRTVDHEDLTHHMPMTLRGKLLTPAESLCGKEEGYGELSVEERTAWELSAEEGKTGKPFAEKGTAGEASAKEGTAGELSVEEGKGGKPFMTDRETEMSPAAEGGGEGL